MKCDVFDYVYINYFVRPILSYNIKHQMWRDWIHINWNGPRDL